MLRAKNSYNFLLLPSRSEMIDFEKNSVVECHHWSAFSSPIGSLDYSISSSSSVENKKADTDSSIQSNFYGRTLKSWSHTNQQIKLHGLNQIRHPLVRVCVFLRPKILLLPKCIILWKVSFAIKIFWIFSFTLWFNYAHTHSLSFYTGRCN